MDFWGFLMMTNILVILGVIIAFWVEINLIDTLWTMAFLTPVTLFIFNKGLGGSANCDDISSESSKPLFKKSATVQR